MQTRILQKLCSVPTAPFVEHGVERFAERFVASRPKLALTRDAAGNLLISLPGTTRASRWIFAAHMDHPGFVARRMLDSKTLEASFFGYVLADYFPRQRVRFFDRGREILAAVIETEMAHAKRPVPSTVRLSVREAVGPGAPGMWNVGEGRIRGGKFLSRVCDDLAGAAAAFRMLDALHRRPPASPVAVLLTRAEEEGFVGAIAASVRPKLLRKSDRIIAIECSAKQPFAPQGKGAIIRIGDRTSIFNSSLSYFLMRQAEALAARNQKLHFQRALMPGGTCEATVYDVYGFHAASVCVALGNYHNMDTERKKIAAEYIDLSDWESMTQLFIHLARTGHEYQPGHRELRSRLEKRFRELENLLDKPLA